LNRSDGLHRVRAADCLRRRFRHSEVPHLSLLNELFHRASDVLDGYIWVDSVLIEEVDCVGLQPPQRRVGNFADVLRAAVRAAAPRSVRGDVEAEFCRDHHLIANGSERLTDEFLICERAVGFRRVEKGDAAIDCRAQQ
jgi:hypothetical protein